MAQSLSNISHQHIISALQEIDREGVRSGRHSSTYDLHHDGKKYPPKLVISIAYRYATGEELDPKSFNGGEGTDAFNLLRELGFQILPKVDPLKELIANYKSYIKTTKMVDEKYKWELIDQYAGRPDVNATDFEKEITDVKFGNLVYQMAPAAAKHIARENPEEFRELFKYLFDDSRSLDDRIERFYVNSLRLYKAAGGQHGHHQDERTISAYLTYHQPNKYVFFKDSFYKEFCSILGEKPAKKNQKYSHYLRLLKTFIADYIEQDQELINMVMEYIPEYYDGSNNLLLAQDILYTMEKARSPSYKEEFTQWINDRNEQGSNKASSYLRSIELLQDKVDFDIYATSDLQVLTNLYEDLKARQSEKEGPYFNESAKSYGANGYYSAAIKSYIQFHEEKSDLITFKAIKEKANEADLERYKRRISYFLHRYNIKKGDERCTFSYTQSQLNFIVGQRYCLVFYFNETKEKFGVISTEPLGTSYESFSGEKVFYSKLERLSFNEHEWKKVVEGFEHQFATTTKSGYRRYHKQDFEDFIYDEIDETNEISSTMNAKNQILYGPPGTGKTFHLKEHLFPMYTTKETSLTQEQFFEQKVQDLTWWQVAALALMDKNNQKVGEIQDNRWVSKKAAMSESKNVRATIWGTLQMHTIEESESVRYTQRQTPLIFNKNEDKSWTLLEQEAKELVPELYELFEEVNKFNPNPDKLIKRYTFSTFHQSFSYEDFIEGIKPVMQQEGEQGDLKYEIQDGIFKDICRRAENDPSNKYAIFIDEINRGNVSSIFGELITLIETDKRIGAKNEMRITLPYSKKPFGVPANLDIYGTMNTADRSVEALDTALRRRFSFVEMMPNPTLLNEIEDGVNLEKLLSVINQRIEALIDRDHTIGHAYLINVQTLDELELAFKDKIIPLLQEYFYGDYGKIGLVLGSGFVEQEQVEDSIFSSFEYEGRESLVQTSCKLKPFENIDFRAAIESLLK